MVTRANIHDLLASYFILDDKYTIMDDMSVDTPGSVRMRRHFKGHKLPVKFGTVGSDFDLTNLGLTTLQNAPHTVGDTFFCGGNKLTTLTHGPKSVKHGYVIGTNPLVNLEGYPDQHAPAWVALSYNDPDLHLLRLLATPKIELWPHIGRNLPLEREKVDQVYQILNKYAGGGKPASLSCAAELIRAGFKGNARW
jgi:hypothetical protein